MLETEQKVIYASHGVCVVVGQEQKIIDRKKVTYLVLEPVGQEGSRYLVPAHNEAAMAKLRRILTREELEEMLCSPAVHTDAWIRDEGQRKLAYRELITGGDRARLMQMVCTLYRHKAAQSAAGKKCHLCDENFLRDAEKLLMGEVAMVMGLEPAAAREYIRKMLKEDA